MPKFTDLILLLCHFDLLPSEHHPIGGVYCKDTSSGIHDVLVTTAESQSLRAPRAPTLSSSGCLRAGAYGTPFDAGSTMMATYRPRSAATPPGSSSASASYISPSASGTPWKGGGGKGAPSPVSFSRPQSTASSPGGGSGPVHRQPVPTLTFPQFLEAIRLLAEDIIGHPQVRGGQAGLACFHFNGAWTPFVQPLTWMNQISFVCPLTFPGACECGARHLEYPP